jgi:hypothetical protein
MLLSFILGCSGARRAPSVRRGRESTVDVLPPANGGRQAEIALDERARVVHGTVTMTQFTVITAP